MDENKERLRIVVERKKELFEKVCDELSEVMSEDEVDLIRTFFVTGWIAGVVEAEITFEGISDEQKKNLSSTFETFSKLLENRVYEYVESLYEVYDKNENECNNVKDDFS